MVAPPGGRKWNLSQNRQNITTDVFSKMAYAEPLKDKTGKRVAEAVEFFLNKIGQQIQNLHTDKGKEFYNSSMSQLLARYGDINHYSTYSSKKASIVERFIRTIKRKLYMEFSLNGSYKWYTILGKVIHTYNNTR